MFPPLAGRVVITSGFLPLILFPLFLFSDWSNRRLPPTIFMVSLLLWQFPSPYGFAQVTVICSTLLRTTILATITSSFYLKGVPPPPPRVMGGRPQCVDGFSFPLRLSSSRLSPPRSSFCSLSLPQFFFFLPSLLIAPASASLSALCLPPLTNTPVLGLHFLTECSSSVSRRALLDLRCLLLFS